MAARLLLLLLVVIWFGACTTSNTVTPSFYYWKTSWQTDSGTTRVFRNVGGQKLYLRLCDVGWNGTAAVPHDVIQLSTPVFPEATLIPVIFLEAAVLRHLKQPAQIQRLAQQLSSFTETFCRQQHWTVSEIQIDCDWSAKTAATYFELLRTLKAQPFVQQKTLSVTLRLHQVKFRAQSGTPPANRCMLMAYNMGDFRTPNAGNSILDVATAKDYLQTLDQYPVPLDLAVPIFRWTLWYRQGRFLGILRSVDPEQLAKQPFLKTTGKANLYTCTQTREWAGYQLQQGDLLKAESPQPDAVAAVTAYVARKISNPFTLAFYHLAPENLTRYGPAQLETILQSAR
ncbi:MAG: hypothetical protein EOP52_04130 [Sphingobacteriales bacterium]|nr:MAG: hypothetical protein EOP52_04130 [Sphingobacteriales bacterium]